jgi:hypothetical protein
MRDEHSIRKQRARGAQIAQRLNDGTLLIEEPQFDPVAGRIDTTWY